MDEYSTVIESLSAAKEYQESLDDAVQRLGRLSEGVYEQVRSEEAKRLNVRVKYLDGAVAAERGGDKGKAEVDLFEPEPWTDNVDGGGLLEAIAAAIREYVVLPDYSADAAALWIVHAHGYELWQITPRLAISAPTSNSGKSVLQSVVAQMVPRALETKNVSAAVMFRAVEAYRPCLMVDEVDTFLKDNDELRGILNSGHEKGGQVLRCEGDNHDIKVFRTFGPVVTTGIGKLPGTLANRSIHIELQRKRRDEEARRFRRDRVDHLRALARQAARWVQDNADALRDHEPSSPPDIFNRDKDNWHALFAIADIVGGKWPARAREIAKTLCAASDDDAESLRVLLLSDIQAIFVESSEDQIRTKDLLTRLHGLEERPWGNFRRGKPLAARTLGDMLRSFKVAPNTIRFSSSSSAKGYKRESFEDAWSRYVTADKTVTPLQVNDTAEYSDVNFRNNEPNVTARNSPKPLKPLTCNGVTEVGEGSTQPAQSPASCVRCGLPIDPDEETIPHTKGKLHAHCYSDWMTESASYADEN